MKKILTLLIILSMVFYSCEKENFTNMQDELQNQTAEMLDEMSELETDINNFLTKMHEEVEGSLPLDSAIYYLEAGFNYRYANCGRDDELLATQVDTSYVDIQIDAENTCSYSSMNESYGNVYSLMETIFNNFSFDDKSLNLVDIAYQQTGNGIELRLISFWKIGTTIMSGDWMWGADLGDCDGNHQGLDATNSIERRYEAKSLSLPYGIWTNIDMSNVYYSESSLMTQNVLTNPFGYGQSLLFASAENSWGTTCLLSEEIDFYVDRVSQIVNRIKGEEGISQTVNKVDIESDWTTSIPNWIIAHDVRLIHGDFESVRVLPGNNDFLSI